jgi:hypothetical protein
VALGPTPSNPASFARSRTELLENLRERRAEIEEAVLNRSHALAGPTESLNPTYQQGLRASITAAIEYGLEVVERGEEHAPPPPPLLLAQARLAARYGVGLDTVLRRYSAGYVLLSDFLVEEAERRQEAIDPEELCRHLSAEWPEKATLALGEPGEG